MKKLEVHLSPETIALLDRYRKRHRLSRPKALQRILSYQINHGTVAKALKELKREGKLR
jgi:hypothetical protein